MMLITSALSLFAATLDQFESFESCSSEGCKFFAQNGRLVGILLFTSGIVMILITVAYIYGYTIQAKNQTANSRHGSNQDNNYYISDHISRLWNLLKASHEEE